jgi:7-cyano-7-deazaguanine synthase in queuosine biosynthesis
VSAAPQPIPILCNGAALPKGRRIRKDSALVLDYRGSHARVKLLLPDFVRGVCHLPDRVLDLLEIAAYVFAADRSISRGEIDAVEYHAWSRSLHFMVKVRDFAFWDRAEVRKKLAAALEFMSGDRSYEFTFQAGHSTPATSLFDVERFAIEPDPRAHVVLFSGGLDSLTGVMDLLVSDSGARLYLVSHQSQSGTIRTQNRLAESLGRLYPGRSQHYRFRCGLQGERADEETQRTRAFLYASTAFALAQALKTKTAIAYENGVTAINFPRRADLLNARASRTTHPKTVALLEAFLSEVMGEPVTIQTPFIWKTKTDVIRLLAERGGTDILSSSVSCSKTFQKLAQASQCGGCSQCIDRRFAAYAAGQYDIDNSGIYAADFITESIEPSTRTTLIDYVRQAQHFAGWGLDEFYNRQFAELVDVVGYTGLAEDETVQRVYDMCHRHGQQVAAAIRRMREVHDHPYQPTPDGSFLKMVAARQYLEESRFDYGKLIAAFANVPPGDEHASAFERLAKDALEGIFHPDLANPKSQVQMNQGRKRIDITFDNQARQGFFARLRDDHQKRCPWIIFECKNYREPLANPEFDQLKGRLGEGSPEVGFIVCRKVDDPTAVLRQCQDRSSGRTGEVVILVLEDKDLLHMLELRAKGKLEEITSYLEDKLRKVLLRA